MRKPIASLAALAIGLLASACGNNAADNTVASTPHTSFPLSGISSSQTATGKTVYKDKLYIPVLTGSFQPQAWRALKAGAEAAAADLSVDIYFNGPASETEIDGQVNMLKGELAKKPDAIALSPLSIEALSDILEEYAHQGIPIIEFDAHATLQTSAHVTTTVSASNAAAAALAVQKLMENTDFTDALDMASSEAPLIIGCLAQEVLSPAMIQRITGFVEAMEQAAQSRHAGKVSIQGHPQWEKQVAKPAVIIRVATAVSTEKNAVQTAANALLNANGLTAVFCASQSAVEGILAAAGQGAELAEEGRYKHLLLVGFDAGSAQKHAVREGWFYGSVIQDHYTIGYRAVEMAYQAATGAYVFPVNVDAKWYTVENIDHEDISLLLYD